MNKEVLKTEGDVNLSKEREQWHQENILDVETLQVLKDDERLFVHQAMSTPCLDVLSSCSDVSIKNLQGKEYLDFHGNNVHQIGFSNTFVINQVKKQLDELSFSTRRYTNKTAVNFAANLTALLPKGLDRVLFAPGGTSVVSMALKLARVVTGRHKVVSYWDSFHGASLDAISAGGEAVFRQHMGPMMPGVIRIPPPMSSGGFFEDEMKSADYLEYVIEKEGEIGAFIAETVRNTDVQIPSKQYWRRIREICTKHDVLLILDEIPIALGRTGKMFAFENFDIEPDILCLGKGLGGGVIPFAAMVCREEHNIAQDISLGHFTHEKSPVGCAAAQAVIDYIDSNNLLQKVNDDAVFMTTALEALKRKHPLISEVRGLGLLWGLELRYPETNKAAYTEAEKIMYSCLSQGLSFKVSQGHVLQLSPALTIQRNDLQKAIHILDKAFGTI
ncbi:aspartate aminotransferase family protein [Snuella sedimenti]|uniref:Aspartate aminotransferase family protein n=1 Tax=Snuella sedimenti TaxID=2798802 RepID=A0A8J7J5N6_9FLAO|nr:aspartate aminotransferase family protein [Snuella sedimenti]MBJ6368954.1 aspartate aminotransferase family protein [Snuella sedimenti]